jgi:hypothetical protein
MLKIRLFLAALIFWFCVLIINLIRPPISNSSVLMDASSSEKMPWKNNFDLVVTGDSRTLIGISPQAMQSILPSYKIGNLGFAALIYSQDYMDYIRNTLHSPVKNRVIVLGFSPRSLLSQEKSGCYFQKWSNKTHVPFKIEINLHSRWLQKLFCGLSEDDLNRCFYSNYHRRMLILLKSGWIPARLFPENATASRKQYRNHFIKNKIDGELLKVIYRNTEIWSREGIKVFGIRIPTSPNLFVIEKKISGFEERSIRQRFEKSGGIWLNPTVGKLVAFDGSHLRYDSAVSYSKSLANELKKFLDKKR